MFTSNEVFFYLNKPVFISVVDEIFYLFSVGHIHLAYEQALQLLDLSVSGRLKPFGTFHECKIDLMIPNKV